MNWEIFTATFVTIFIAEMGDKTQFAALAASAEAEKIWPVWLAVVGALSLAGTIGVLAGKVVGSILPEALQRPLSGGLFILVGCWILWKG